MLSADQIEQYHEDGFLVVHDVLDQDDLQAMINYCESLTDALAKELYINGELTNLHKDLGYKYRLSKLEQEYPGAGVMATLRRKMSPEIFQLWTNEKLLCLIESLLGTDFDGHPFWSLRAKTPNQDLLEVPWHQDCSYLNKSAYSTFQPTLWIPFVDANSENGCMQFARGLHKLEKEFSHTPQRSAKTHSASWYLEIDSDVLRDAEIVTCEVPLGSLIISNQLIPHRSLPNVSAETRWSIDLRYQKPGLNCGANKKPLPIRRFSTEERLEALKARELFKSTEVSCLANEKFLAAHGNHPWLERWMN